MNDTPTTRAPDASYRIDKFIVPAAAMDVFIARVRRVQRLLDEQPGCLQNLVLTKAGGPAEFNLVTIVQWASEADRSRAQQAMQMLYAQEGFRPDAFMRELGVRADLGLYAEEPA